MEDTTTRTRPMSIKQLLSTLIELGIIKSWQAYPDSEKEFLIEFF